MSDVVRIGCWAAFWGDTSRAARQLLAVPDVHYLVSDYLAEITMALLARARTKDPDGGFVRDAVDALAPLLPELHERGIKVVTNAGALNPTAFARTLREAADAAGVALRVAAVEGDDLLPRLDEIMAAEPRDMFTGAPIPLRVSSMNAYLGARPIATALDAGADIVVTGRCVDAAVVLGPLMHEFGWSDSDHDRLSGGSLVGHIVECGPQCTGGNHTDWESVPGWDDIGYPIAECRPDGTAVITKPPGTGGLVSPATVGEQVLYEIGDPGAYILPDVICDWRDVTLEQEDRDRVLVSGARGSAPTTSYKATATSADGFRAMSTALFAGLDAAGRARRAGDALVARTSRLMAEDGFGAPAESSVEVIGAGDTGGDARGAEATEAVVKIGLRHAERDALEIFSREFAPMGLVAQGMTGLFAGRPRVAPVFRVFHLLVVKVQTPVVVRLGDDVIPVEVAAGAAQPRVATAQLADRAAQPPADAVTVPLRAIAYGRSGDKGDKANIALIARRPEFASVIAEQVTTERVADAFAHHLSGGVERWELPGLHAVNFLLDAVLGGTGGTSTLRYDPQGKSYAAMLLTLEVRVPAEWARDGRLAGAEAVPA